MKNKKFLSLVLAIAMLVSMFSVGLGSITASAAELSCRLDGDWLEITSYSTFEEFKEFIDSQTEETLNAITWFSVGVLSNVDQTVEEDAILYLAEKIPNVEILSFNDFINVKVEYVNLFPKLREVDFIDCGISDISPIADCPNLESVCLNFNNISDISPISKCKNLKELHLTDNRITDISPIANCPNLTTINFKDNFITDIRPIAECTNLTNVYFQNNYITDISPMFVTGKITTASFIDNNITDIDITDPNIEPYFRNNYKKISYIDIYRNPLSAEFFTYIKNVRTYSKLNYKDEVYNGIVELNDSDFRNLIFDSLKVDNETKTITINSREDASYVAFNNISPNKFYTYTVVEDSIVEKYTSARYKVKKPADSNTYTTKLVAEGIDSLKLAKACYTLVVNFIESKPTFEFDKLTLKNATNKSFDAENSALTIDTEANYVRVYKALTNGSTVSVDAEKYDFVIEYDKFYQINKAALALSDLNIATFEMTTDSGDTVTTTVNFPGAGELPFTKLFKITNYDSLTQEENVINLDIVDTKTFSIIYKDVADGSTLTIESDSAFVEERDNCYVLRQRAVGETITMTYGDTIYTINLTK